MESHKISQPFPSHLYNFECLLLWMSYVVPKSQAGGRRTILPNLQQNRQDLIDTTKANRVQRSRKVDLQLCPEWTGNVSSAVSGSPVGHP